MIFITRDTSSKSEIAMQKVTLTNRRSAVELN